MQYRAVVFDFDGTIIDTETHLYESINKALIAQAFEPITIDFYRTSIGHASSDLDQFLLEKLGEAGISQMHDTHHLGVRKLPVHPEIKKVIEKLHSRHVPMAIATSSHRHNVQPIIDAIGLGGYFQVIIGREDVENVKPDPEPYLKAVQALNMNPTKCLAFEDSSTGATSALNAGLDVIVNTNQMTETQDFSNLEVLGHNMTADEIIEKYFS